MLPDFSSVKSVIRRAQLKFVQNDSQSRGVLSQVKAMVFYEGSVTKFRRPDGSGEEMRPNSIAGKLTLSTKEAENLTHEQIAEKLADVSKQISDQQMQMMFKQVEQYAKEYGNTATGSLKENGPEMILNMYDKILVQFDDDGIPSSSSCSP